MGIMINTSLKKRTTMASMTVLGFLTSILDPDTLKTSCWFRLRGKNARLQAHGALIVDN